MKKLICVALSLILAISCFSVSFTVYAKEKANLDSIGCIELLENETESDYMPIVQENFSPDYYKSKEYTGAGKDFKQKNAPRGVSGDPTVITNKDVFYFQTYYKHWNDPAIGTTYSSLYLARILAKALGGKCTALLGEEATEENIMNELLTGKYAFIIIDTHGGPGSFSVRDTSNPKLCKDMRGYDMVQTFKQNNKSLNGAVVMSTACSSANCNTASVHTSISMIDAFVQCGASFAYGSYNENYASVASQFHFWFLERMLGINFTTYEVSSPKTALEAYNETYDYDTYYKGRFASVRMMSVGEGNVILNSDTPNNFNTAYVNTPFTDGYGITWSYNAENTTLTISGTGEVRVIPEVFYLVRKKLTNVVFEEGITLIGKNLFLDFQYISDVTIPSTVRTIEKDAFQYARRIRSITYADPDNVDVAIDAFDERVQSDIYGVARGAFDNIEWIYDKSENVMTFTGTGNLDYDFSFGDLLQYYNSKGYNVVVGNGITQIGQQSFAECNYMSRIELGENVNKLCSHCFEYLSNFKTAVIKSDTINFDRAAFLCATGFKELIFANEHMRSVTIGPDTLLGAGVSDLNITADNITVKTKGFNASALKTLTLNGTNVTVEENGVCYLPYSSDTPASKYDVIERININAENPSVHDNCYYDTTKVFVNGVRMTPIEGVLNPGVEWSIDEDTNTLIISGSGTFTQQQISELLPERAFKSTETVVIGENIQDIPLIVFNNKDWKKLKTIKLNNTNVVGELSNESDQKYVNADIVIFSTGELFIGGDTLSTYEGYYITLESTAGVTVFENAFNDCPYLYSVTIKSAENSVTVKDNAFKNCTGLGELTLEAYDSINISDSAFDGCDRINRINANAFTVDISEEIINQNTRLNIISVCDTPVNINSDTQYVFYSASSTLMLDGDGSFTKLELSSVMDDRIRERTRYAVVKGSVKEVPIIAFNSSEFPALQKITLFTADLGDTKAFNIRGAIKPLLITINADIEIITGENIYFDVDSFCDYQGENLFFTGGDSVVINGAFDNADKLKTLYIRAKEVEINKDSFNVSTLCDASITATEVYLDKEVENGLKSVTINGTRVYKLTVIPNGGSFGDTDLAQITAKLKTGDEYAFDTPVREGYEFARWLTDENVSCEISGDKTVVTMGDCDIKLVAEWKEIVASDPDTGTDSHTDSEAQSDPDTSSDTNTEDTTNTESTETDAKDSDDTNTEINTESEIDTSSATDTEPTSQSDTESDNTSDTSTDTEKATDTDKQGMTGDLNGDGVVTMEDVVILQKHIAKLVEFTVEQTKLADVNGDGIVNMLDVTTIQKYIAKLIEKF
ncbi:MAG: leucine-rich repeat protein [Clostridiales bacterium]|nr:leucine-rich repeat protein [Clostridiales bacterium]